MGNFFYLFAKTVLSNEAEADSDGARDALDVEQGGSSSEESAETKPVTKKRKNVFVEDKEEDTKHKSVSVFIHLILSLLECKCCLQE